MNCPQCTNEMVKAVATNFGDSYDYCRVCKKELSEMSAKTPRLLPYPDARSLSGVAAWAGVDHGRIGSAAPNAGAIPQSYPPPPPCYVSNGRLIHNFPSFVPGVNQTCACGAQTSLLARPMLRVFPIGLLNRTVFWHFANPNVALKCGKRAPTEHVFASWAGADAIQDGQVCECGDYSWDRPGYLKVISTPTTLAPAPIEHFDMHLHIGVSNAPGGTCIPVSGRAVHTWAGSMQGLCNCGKVTA